MNLDDGRSETANMRKATMTVICLGVLLEGMAAWAQNTFPATGNVGIGTTATR
jgi:hypothetical protein